MTKRCPVVGYGVLACSHDLDTIRTVFRGLPTGLVNALIRGGYHTLVALASASDDDLLAVTMIGPQSLTILRAWRPVSTQRHCPTCTCALQTPDA